MWKLTGTTLICAAALSLAACSSIKSRLLSADPMVRADALTAAAKAPAPEQADIVSMLKIKLLRGRSERRAYAAAALEDIGPAAAAAAPELFEAMSVPNPDISGPAGRALRRLSGASAFLAGRLASEFPEERQRAETLLLGHGEESVRPLADNFTCGDIELAIRSTVVLARLGPVAGKAVPVLVRAAVSSDPALRGLASSALVDIGTPAGLWLSDTLRSPNPRYRLGASIVLAGLYDPPAEALDTLAGAVWDEDPEVRLNAATALAAYTPGKLSALPDDRVSGLMTAARETGKTAVLAARALMKSGKAPQYWLEASLTSRSSETRKDAAEAISAMSPPPPTASWPLLKALEDGSPEVRKAAAAALGKYSVTSAAAFPNGSYALLSAALKDPDAGVRLLTVVPLARLASSDKDALARLIKALSHSDPEVRIAAAKNIEPLGRKAASAEKALWKAFRTSSCRQKSAAARTLAAVNPRLRKASSLAKARRMICTEGEKVAADPASLPGMKPKKKKTLPPKKRRPKK